MIKIIQLVLPLLMLVASACTAPADQPTAATPAAASKDKPATDSSFPEDTSTTAAAPVSVNAKSDGQGGFVAKIPGGTSSVINAANLAGTSALFRLTRIEVPGSAFDTETSLHLSEGQSFNNVLAASSLGVSDAKAAGPTLVLTGTNPKQEISVFLPISTGSTLALAPKTLLVALLYIDENGKNILQIISDVEVDNGFLTFKTKILGAFQAFETSLIATKTSVESPVTIEQVKSKTSIDTSQTIGDGSCGSVANGATASRTRYLDQSVAFGSSCASETQNATCNNGTLGGYSGTYAFDSCSVDAAAACGGTAHGAQASRTRYQAATMPYGSSCASETQNATCNNGTLGGYSGTYAFDSCSVDAAAACGGTAHGAQASRTRYQVARMPYGSSCASETQNATCSNGTLGGYSGTYSFDTCSVDALPAPATSSASTGSNTYVVLSWTPVAGATSYNVYWATSPGVTSGSIKIPDLSPSYLHSGLTNGQTYYYRISSVDGSEESSLSTEISGMPLAPPTITTKNPSAGAVNAPNNSVITAIFSRAMDSSSIGPTSFFLKDSGNNAVAGTVSYSGSTATFTPTTNLSLTSTYTATVTTSVTDTYSNQLDTQTAWSFTVMPGTPVWNGSLATAAAPSSRFEHSAIWTGSKMIVWGGWNGSFSPSNFFNSGGSYDPALNQWAAISTTGVPSARARHSTVWTGTKMIVFGGSDSSDFSLTGGGIYDPGLDSWSSLSATGSPSARKFPTAVWTGSKMLVWGGVCAGTCSPTVVRGDGAGYNPATNVWSTISATNAPAARTSHTAVWTGSKMLVWGGSNGAGTRLSNGGSYDPANDQWTTLATTNAPSAREFPAAVWTGSTMIVWGGSNVSGAINSGAMYDPSTDTWTTMTATSAPAARANFAYVWTGARFIVWGGTDLSTGNISSGSVFDPAENTWTTISNISSPGAVQYPKAIWTGEKAVFFGGQPSNSGGWMTFQ